MKGQIDEFQLNRSKPANVLLGACYALLLLALLLFGGSAFAAADIEDISDEDTITVEPVETLSADEISDLVAPVALYPDDLLAIVLPAATYPVQVVQAARFLEARKADTTLEPDEDWDDSIVALLNYPEVVALLNDDLDWTWQLGEAVLVQEADVISAVSDFRERARVAGNLESDEHQVVAVDEEGAIEIKPADPEVIYVPYYEPERVTVYQRYPAYHYYPRGYPLYYYPYPSDYYFSSGFWGVTSAYSIGWSTHNLHLHHYGFDGHPYHSYSYYDPFYYRFPHLWLSFNYTDYHNHYRDRRHHRRHHRGNRWQPDRERAGSRPRNRNRDHRDWRDERRYDRELTGRRREHLVAQRRALRNEERSTFDGARSTTNDAAPDGVPNIRETTRRDRTRTSDRRVARADRTTNDVRRASLTTEPDREDVARRPARNVRSRSSERVAATQGRRQSVDRRSTREISSRQRERIARIAPATALPERRTEARRRARVSPAVVRTSSVERTVERARQQPRSETQTRRQARAPTPVVRQTRAREPRRAAPVQRQPQQVRAIASQQSRANASRQSRDNVSQPSRASASRSRDNARSSNHRAAERQRSSGQRKGRRDNHK